MIGEIDFEVNEDEEDDEEEEDMKISLVFRSQSTYCTFSMCLSDAHDVAVKLLGEIEAIQQRWLRKERAEGEAE